MGHLLEPIRSLLLLKPGGSEEPVMQERETQTHQKAGEDLGFQGPLAGKGHLWGEPIKVSLESSLNRQNDALPLSRLFQNQPLLNFVVKKVKKRTEAFRISHSLEFSDVQICVSFHLLTSTSGCHSCSPGGLIKSKSTSLSSLRILFNDWNLFLLSCSN